MGVRSQRLRGADRNAEETQTGVDYTGISVKR